MLVEVGPAHSQNSQDSVHSMHREAVSGCAVVCTAVFPLTAGRRPRRIRPLLRQGRRHGEGQPPAREHDVLLREAAQGTEVL